MTRAFLAAWAPLATTRAGRFASDTYLALRGVIHGFRGEFINLRAGSLTFISIFSLVPMVTVALALLQLLHQDALRLRLTTFIRDLLAPGIQHESAAFLDKFINSASSTAAGSLGFFFLMASAGMLLRHLDASLNEIWAVQRARPLWVSFGLYALALTFGPVVAGAWLIGTATIRRLIVDAGFPFSAEFIILGSIALSVGVLTLIYKLAPHAPVRWRSALAGGLVGGVGWEAAKHLYARFAVLVFKANPIYGSLSAAPLFLMWIYLSWLLVLLGARLSYAVEHATFRGEFMDLVHHPRTKELLGARLAQLTAAAHLQKVSYPTIRSLARRLRVPEQMLAEVARLLVDAQLLVLGPRGALRPAREPHELTLADLSAAVGGVPKLMPTPEWVPKVSEFQEVEQLFADVDEASIARLKAVTWSQLATRLAASPARSTATAKNS